MKGLFITFEGIEGSGKTTQIERIAARLTRLGYAVVTTREPGGTELGEEIRKTVLAPRAAAIDSRAELFLYLASRSQLVHEVIRPALRNGKIVLCDRFTDATLAYQGYGRRLNLRELKNLTGSAAGGLTPKLTLLFDLPVDTAISRVRRRGGGNRLDLEALAFHRRVRRGYLQLARGSRGRIAVVQGNLSPEALEEAVWSAIEPALPRSPHSGKGGRRKSK